MSGNEKTQTRTTTPPARPRDRGDRWRMAAEWAVTIAAAFVAIGLAAVVGVGVLLATIEGGVTWLGFTPVQALTAAGLVGFVVLPAALLAIHRWVRPILNDRPRDDVDALAATVADNPQRRGFSDVDLWRLVAARQAANEQMRGPR